MSAPDPYPPDSQMTLVYDRWGIQVHHGDCLDVMRSMPDRSVHSVVTDPPSGTGFMGREWDKNRGGRAQWVGWLTQRMAEAHRVLKPGGHALVWALPRTSHWTALALDDSGFEIRDCITHLFGSGFPKSLGISKSIDRSIGVDRPVLGYTNGARNGNGRNSAYGGFSSAEDGQYSVTASATDEARLWDGWGTALKPSSEHWWLVRKPLVGTVAGNVVEHGTGALNIDACRVPAVGRPHRSNTGNGPSAGVYGDGLHGSRALGIFDQGRWPPNTVLSHAALVDPESGEVLGDACADGCVEGCPVTELDQQSGVTSSRVGKPRGAGAGDGWGMTATGSEYDDHGGASRFFPVFRWAPKAPQTERPRVNGKSHETVKSVDLMRWLTRLVTPPGGVVLDCFAGTGTTGQAARAEGFSAVLIESDPLSLPLITARLDSLPKTEAPVNPETTIGTEVDLFSFLDGSARVDGPQ